jgi:hypothetical protein
MEEVAVTDSGNRHSVIRKPDSRMILKSGNRPSEKIMRKRNVTQASRFNLDPSRRSARDKFYSPLQIGIGRSGGAG